MLLLFLRRLTTCADHCGFPDHKGFRVTCAEAVNGRPNDCIARCSQRYGWCDSPLGCATMADAVETAISWGVVLSPLKLPSTVSADFADQHPIPWGKPIGIEDLRYGYGGKVNITCDKSLLTYVTDDTMVCAGVEPRDETGATRRFCAKTRAARPDASSLAETAEGFVTTEDPLDPFFYSTCFVPKTIITFDDTPPAPKKTSMKWRYTRSCVDCEVRLFCCECVCCCAADVDAFLSAGGQERVRVAAFAAMEDCRQVRRLLDV